VAISCDNVIARPKAVAISCDNVIARPKAVAISNPKTAVPRSQRQFTNFNFDSILDKSEQKLARK
jgi:hypothetical protein